MSHLSVIQKAAAEAVWRALQDRNVDKTGLNLSREMPEPQLRAHICDYVLALPTAYLPRLVLPEINQFGALTGGYTQRWPAPSSASLQHAAYIAAQNRSYSTDKAVALPDVSNSTTSFSPDNSSNEDEDITPRQSNTSAASVRTAT